MPIHRTASKFIKALPRNIEKIPSSSNGNSRVPEHKIGTSHSPRSSTYILNYIYSLCETEYEEKLKTNKRKKPGFEPRSSQHRAIDLPRVPPLTAVTKDSFYQKLAETNLCQKKYPAREKFVFPFSTFLIDVSNNGAAKDPSKLFPPGQRMGENV